MASAFSPSPLCIAGMSPCSGAFTTMEAGSDMVSRANLCWINELHVNYQAVQGALRQACTRNTSVN
jgi:hypothetical protein